MAESINLGKYHKSLEYYQLKYGREEGEDKFVSSNARKAITLANMIRVHGEDEGIRVYDNWKRSVAQTLETMIARYGEDEGRLKYRDFVKKKICRGGLSAYNKIDEIFDDKIAFFGFLYERLPMLKQYHITKDYIKRYIYDDSGFVQYIVSFLFDDEDEFYTEFENYITSLNPIHDKFMYIRTNNNNMGAFFVTHDGLLLRSSLECHFYSELCKFGLDNILFYVDLKYPNQQNTRYRYDFYFPDFDEYVEIAGMVENESYRKNLMIKKSLFSPVILYTEADITKYIMSLAERYQKLEDLVCH